MNPNDRPPITDDQWRNRFILLNLVRIGGTLVVMLGLLVWQTNLVRPGGWGEVGLPLALIGLLISFGLSRTLLAKWRTPPGQ
jgi:hypothetical protein